jgi:hypothetical protein
MPRECGPRLLRWRVGQPEARLPWSELRLGRTWFQVWTC